MKSIISFIIFSLFPLFVLSQTTISGGEVSGTWTLANSPYLIEGDIEINSSDTLIIEPGVVIEFQHYDGLFVYGCINAKGTITDSILFTVDDTTGYSNHHSHSGWKGIRFNNASEIDSSFLSYCIIEYGKGFENYGGGLFIIYTDNVSITNSVIQNCYISGSDSYGAGVAILLSNPFMRDILVQNNKTYDYGGGMMIANDSLDAKRITIINNYAREKGGGLYSTFGSESLYEFTISNNSSGVGGGIYTNSSLKILDSDISGNSADYSGGGIYLEGNSEIHSSSIHDNYTNGGGGIFIKSDTDENSKVFDCYIYNNHAYEAGGGIYISSEGNTWIRNSVFDSNYAKYGGGVYFKRSAAKLEGLTIKNNDAGYGGGIYFNTSQTFPVNMDTVNMCNIYSNNGIVGREFFSYGTVVDMRIDTFSVQNPTDYYVMPIEHFSISIENGLTNLVNEDFFISPTGSDLNTGLSTSVPFKTIDHALSVLYTDDQNSSTIYIDDGVYSPSATGERFPLLTMGNLKLQGSAATILDAENTDRIAYSYEADSLFFSNLTLRNGNTDDHGGGIYLKNSLVQLDNLEISNCSANIGGGLCLIDSPVLTNNITISNNQSELVGGGLYVVGIYENSVINNAVIRQNSATKGGGVFTSGHHVFEDVSVYDNTASESGGGIYNSYYLSVFDSANRSSIYANSSVVGNDLFNSSDSILHVYVDTFTVIEPTAYHASPLSLFDLDILVGKYNQITNDVYISVDGDNSNTGLSWEESLKTISNGTTRSLSDSLNPITIHLGAGTYSMETNGEFFPITPIGYSRLIGYDEVVLDADAISNLISINNAQYVELNNFSLQNGYAEKGGGISIHNSHVFISNLIVKDNLATKYGGGIWVKSSDVYLLNSIVKNNSSIYKRGGISVDHSNVNISNSIFDNNHSNSMGAITSVYSDIAITGSRITNNHDNEYSGGLSLYYSNVYLYNCTFSNNTTNEYWSGTLHAYDSVNLSIENCIFWEEQNHWDIFARGDDYQTNVGISYSSLTDGENSIGTEGNVELKYTDTNISGDPLFMETDPYPYQISEYSPCINVGSPDTIGMNLLPVDIAGNPRIYDGYIDMGAFEWGPFVDTEPPKELVKEIIIYPNPASELINIKLNPSLNSISEISLYNQLGQCIINKKENTEVINISTVTPGLYIIEIESNNKLSRSKIIVR